jgi:hypothetical protein
VECGWLGEALSFFVPAITQGFSRRGLLDVMMIAVFADAGETSVEVLLPEGGAVCSFAALVGHWSLGWMPLAAGTGATSPIMAAFGRLPGCAHTGCVSSWLAWPSHWRSLMSAEG